MTAPSNASRPGRAGALPGAVRCRRGFGALALAGLAVVGLPAAAGAAGEPAPPPELVDALARVAQAACRTGPDAARPPAARVVDERRDMPLPGARGALTEWRLEDGDHIRLSTVQMANRPGALVFADHYEAGAGGSGLRPTLRVVVGGPCQVLGGRWIVYDSSAGRPVPSHIRALGRTLAPTEERIELNAPPPTGRPTPGCFRVGLLDSGVNYALPQIAGRLAYGETGQMVGYDFWEDDRRPYDYGFQEHMRDPRVSAFSPRHHGTGVASILLRDAADPGVCLAAYRYHPADLDDRIGEVIDRVAADGVKVVVLTSGRNRPWPEFKAALERHPGLLLVVAAGNEGRDLTQRPLFPQAYRLPNVIVVGATDAGGAPWPQSNRGAGVVDVAVPAVDIDGFDHSGRPRRLTGTSLAAPRIGALAALLWRGRPASPAADIRALVLARAAGSGTPATALAVDETRFQEVLREAGR